MTSTVCVVRSADLKDIVAQAGFLLFFAARSNNKKTNKTPATPQKHKKNVPF